MTGITTEYIESFDGTRVAVRRMGEGRPVLMFHGLFSNAEVNWIKFGTAQRLVDAGFEAIMPDWRVHGLSETSEDPSAFPGGVLVQDALAIQKALGIAEYDLVGFSLGSRTAISAVIAGLSPRRLVLGGIGLEGLTNWQKRTEFFIDMIDRFDDIERGDPAFFAKSFMEGQGTNRVAARLLLTQGVENIDIDDLHSLSMPTMVLIGDEDRDNGSPWRLADELPDAHVNEIPGNHMSCVTKPEFGRAIVDFLSQD